MSDFKHLWTPPPGEAIVGLVQYRDYIIMATNRGVYKVIHDDDIDITISQIELVDGGSE